MTWVWRAVAIVFAAVIDLPRLLDGQLRLRAQQRDHLAHAELFPRPLHVPQLRQRRQPNKWSGKAYFWDDARNSLIVVTSAVVITLVVAFLAAAAISRFRLRGAAVFLVLILVVQMVPGTALIIPMFLLLNNLHLTDNYFGLILVYAATTLPFTIWVLRGFVRGVPIELEEAGQVDGPSRFGAFVRILLPLVLPGLIATGIFAFITAWNDFLVADVIMQQNDHQTLPVWLFSFTTNTGTDYGGLMAGCTIMALPVVIFFLFVQRRIVSGFTAGAVKG